MRYVIGLRHMLRPIQLQCGYSQASCGFFFSHDSSQPKRYNREKDPFCFVPFICSQQRYNRTEVPESKAHKSRAPKNLTASTVTRMAQQHHHKNLSQHVNVRTTRTPHSLPRTEGLHTLTKQHLFLLSRRTCTTHLSHSTARQCSGNSLVLP